MLVRRRTRAALEAAALFYATDRGWPVLPGAYLLTEAGVTRCSCGAARCAAPGAHPVVGAGTVPPTATRSPSLVRVWWSHHPHTVLLPCGVEFDVLEAPARVGHDALLELEMLGSRIGPVLRAPDGHLQFLVQPGAAEVFGYTLAHNDATNLDVRLLGVGHLLAAPGSGASGGGDSQWAVAPDPADRQLPEAVELLGALVRSCQPPNVSAAVLRPRG